MSNGVCPVHLVAWKTVPAGISSKTGKPYNSFTACPVKGCPQRPAAPPAWNGPQASVAAPQATIPPPPDPGVILTVGALSASIDNLAQAIRYLADKTMPVEERRDF
jgi:hypothetical protein